MSMSYLCYKVVLRVLVSTTQMLLAGVRLNIVYNTPNVGKYISVIVNIAKTKLIPV